MLQIQTIHERVKNGRIEGVHWADATYHERETMLWTLLLGDQTSREAFTLFAFERRRNVTDAMDDLQAELMDLES